MQADAFTNSRIATVVAVVITSNLRLASAPGNVLLQATESGLSKDSVINMSQIVSLDKDIAQFHRPLFETYRIVLHSPR